MPQWFLRFSEFPEFTEFNESSAPFRENSNIAICVLAVPFEIHWTTKVTNKYKYNTIGIKKEIANVWEHTNGNIVIIANVVYL